MQIYALLFLIARLLRPFTGTLHRMQDRWRSRGTTGWPTVNGYIQMVEVKEPVPCFWRVEIAYSYSAGGEYWAGETCRTFFAEEDADRYVEQHAKGSVLVVSYRPDKPSKCVVLSRDQLAASATPVM